jgi:hypothetical protein
VIRSLQSGLTRELALRRLSPPWPFGILRRWMTGKLLGVSEIYIPYRLYSLNIQGRSARNIRFLAVDAATGTLDPYEFSAEPSQSRCLEVETRNRLPIRLDQNETHALVLEKVRRLLFSKGAALTGAPTIAAECVGPEFYIPYWAGFFGEELNVRVLMLNAVRGTMEGNKIAGAVKAWLLERADENLTAAGVECSPCSTATQE